MRTRKEVAEYINLGKCVKDADEKYGTEYNFGKCELFCLMDFIYEGEPKDADEHITNLD